MGVFIVILVEVSKYVQCDELIFWQECWRSERPSGGMKYCLLKEIWFFSVIIAVMMISPI